jgi:hypothetical protein
MQSRGERGVEEEEEEEEEDGMCRWSQEGRVHLHLQEGG